MDPVKHLTELIEQKNTLIIRIAGLTDLVLQEQLKEEYDIIEENITNAEKKYIHGVFVEITNQHIDYYANMFVKEQNVVKVLEVTNNIVMQILIEKSRIRIPVNARDRRAFLVLCNVLGCVVIVKDMEGFTVDVIGDENKLVKQPLTLYVSILSRLQTYDETSISSINYLIPKHLLV